ncbi:calcium/sodium antiporter [Parabacteroides acidifaciens]|uniref:Calcium/sodium antiporter n=1 Tax=Parabacteroides acidifaciens TaxID=2290935 RepID=A0A3D8H8X9_9BACT|nr:calcium/sodium antiporter [Parabacteroides acidifaciens]MBC8603825.1 calcium/sodium antiporter [Parabacteroides acidifaciens]RDU47426.1 sodium:calcium antiporter [Parabacteroides acidifaciens]
MITSLTLLILSLVALYIGAGWLVQGSSALALKAKISPLVIGLTIVAFGTSAPELVVSLNAALKGEGEIAIGNILGSNIFNIGIILGISATIYPLQAKKQLLRIDIPVMLIATILLTIFFWNGELGRMEGGFFLAGIILYTIFSLYYSRKHGEEPNLELEEQPRHWAFDTLEIVGGLVVLIFASHLLVENATSIAREVGLSEAVIGLTIIAAGTSMPELATTIVAASKGKTDIAIGNIVGSNLFNILAIASSCSLVQPIVAKNVNYIDLLVMLAISLLLLPLVKSGQKITRTEGLVLVIVYVIYMFWLFRDVI